MSKEYTPEEAEAHARWIAGTIEIAGSYIRPVRTIPVVVMREPGQTLIQGGAPNGFIFEDGVSIPKFPGLEKAKAEAKAVAHLELKKVPK